MRRSGKNWGGIAASLQPHWSLIAASLQPYLGLIATSRNGKKWGGMEKIKGEWKKLRRNGEKWGWIEKIEEKWKKMRRNGKNCVGMEKNEEKWKKLRRNRRRWRRNRRGRRNRWRRRNKRKRRNGHYRRRIWAIMWGFILDFKDYLSLNYYLEVIELDVKFRKNIKLGREIMQFFPKYIINLIPTI